MTSEALLALLRCDLSNRLSMVVVGLGLRLGCSPRSTCVILVLTGVKWKWVWLALYGMNSCLLLSLRCMFLNLWCLTLCVVSMLMTPS